MLNNLFKKTFVINFLILSMSFVLLYIIIYYFLPLYYVEYQTNKFNNNVKTMVSTLESKDELNKSAFTTINNINNINFRIYDDDGNMIFINDEFGHGISMPPDIKFNKQEIHQEDQLHVEKEIKVGDEKYTIFFMQHLDSVTGIRKILYLLIPYMIFIGIALGLLASYIFAKTISKPIEELNKQAIDISNLNFKNQKVIKRNDEIGELSNNIYIMSKDLEEALEQLKKDVNAANDRDRERKELMAILSHELKTPITILSGQTECMIAGIGKYKDHQKYLKENLKEYNKLNQLVNQILTFSKIDNFDLKLKLEEIEIKKLIEDKIEEYQNIFQTKKLKVILDCEIETMILDKNLIDLIIKNLIENAFKYAKEESAIKIKLDKNNFEISNQVNDEFKKTPEELSKPFIQNDDSRNTEGYGLGLYIIDKAIEKHQFKKEIEVKNTEFIFKINFNKISK